MRRLGFAGSCTCAALGACISSCPRRRPAAEHSDGTAISARSGRRRIRRQQSGGVRTTYGVGGGAGWRGCRSAGRQLTSCGSWSPKPGVSANATHSLGRPALASRWRSYDEEGRATHRDRRLRFSMDMFHSRWDTERELARLQFWGPPCTSWPARVVSGLPRYVDEPFGGD
jgi:hypothetical protein